jgi:hypothetical protein
VPAPVLVKPYAPPEVLEMFVSMRRISPALLTLKLPELPRMRLKSTLDEVVALLLLVPRISMGVLTSALVTSRSVPPAVPVPALSVIE